MVVLKVRVRLFAIFLVFRFYLVNDLLLIFFMGISKVFFLFFLVFGGKKGRNSRKLLGLKRLKIIVLLKYKIFWNS